MTLRLTIHAVRNAEEMAEDADMPRGEPAANGFALAQHRNNL